MGYFVRQSTATAVMIGPLVDDTDFKTRESALTYNQAGIDVAIQKGASGTWDAVTPTNTGGDNDWVNLGDGHYTLELTAAQTGTVGPLKVSYFATGVLPWSDVFYVVEESVFDALYASGAGGFAYSGPTAASIADAVCDEVITTGHDVNNSLADKLKYCATYIGYTQSDVVTTLGKVNNATYGLQAIKTAIDGLPAAVWASATRTLTAVADSSGITTLLARVGGVLNINGGRVEADMTAINGGATDGNNAVLKLKGFDVRAGASGDAVYFQSGSGMGDSGFRVHGQSAGIFCDAAADEGVGIAAYGGGVAGHGIHANANSTQGHGVLITAGSNAASRGVLVSGGAVGFEVGPADAVVNGAAVKVVGHGTGAGLHVEGGGYGDGVLAQGNRDGSGVRAVGGDTGNGISAFAGNRGECGFHASAAVGSSGAHGIVASGSADAVDIVGTIEGLEDVAGAVRSELAVELARIDIPVSESGASASEVWSAPERTLTDGAGSIDLEYRVLLDTDGDGVPDDPAVGIPDVRCVLTSDAAGEVRVGSPRVSDTQGYVRWFGLAAGTYYVWRDRADYEFSNPDTEVIA